MADVTTTTTTKASPIAERDTPAVLAYRVGQLETAVTNGLHDFGEKLEALVNQFTPLKDHLTLEKRVTKLESNSGIQETIKWVVLVASVIINIVTVAKIVGAL